TREQVVQQVLLRAGFGPGFGDKAKDVVDAYAKAFPGKKPVEIWSLVSSNRQSAVALADAKSKQPAPVYMSWFGWKSPLFDDRLRAFHCIDICFWLHNTDLMLTHTGGGARPRKLATWSGPSERRRQGCPGPMRARHRLSRRRPCTRSSARADRGRGAVPSPSREHSRAPAHWPGMRCGRPCAHS